MLDLVSSLQLANGPPKLLVVALQLNGTPTTNETTSPTSTLPIAGVRSLDSKPETKR